MLEIKGTVLRTLMDWSNTSGVMSFSSVLDFLDFCISFLISTLPVYCQFFS